MKSQICFGVILLMAFLGRYTLLNGGFLNDLDEYLFFWIQQNDGHLLEPVYWFKAVNEVQAQLPELFIRSLQYKFLSWFFPDTCFFSISHLKWIGVFNALVVVLQAIALKKILTSTGVKSKASHFVIAIWLILANTNIYCRHILPYDHALLFWLWAIYFSFSKIKFKHWLSGFLAALGVLTYWGSIPALLFFGFSVLQRYKLKSTLPFVLPFFILFLSIEIGARQHGFSYYTFLFDYQKTIHTGNFDEGFIYPFLYLFKVESVAGIGLLFLFLVALYLIYKAKSKTDGWLVYPTLFSLLTFSSAVYFLHSFVWYGRVLHFILPFVALVCYKSIEFISEKKHFSIVFTLVILSLYIGNMKNWRSIQYPRNVIEKYATQTSKNQFQFETKVGLRIDNNPYLPMCLRQEKNIIKEKLIFVNAGFLQDYPTWKFIQSKQKLNPNSRFKLIAKGLHFQSSPFYQFEYNDRNGRNYFQANQFQIRIYSCSERRK